MVLRQFKIIKDVILTKNNLKAVSFWVLVLFFSLIFQAYGFGINRVLPRNLVENIGTLVILLSFSLLLKGLLGKIVQSLCFLLFWFNCLFESIYYYIFNANISASSIFVIFETNLAEAREFAEFYLHPFIVFVVLTFILLLVIYFIHKPFFVVSSQLKFQKIVFTLGVIIPLVIMVYKGFQRFNFLYLSVASTIEYYEQQQKMIEFNIDRPLANIEGFRIDKQIDTATYVLIIGESTTRGRLSLFHYQRQTTPFLDSLKPSLWLYEDVISSYPNTIGALREALVTNGLQSKKDFSIVQMMNQAGFKTFWISNQRPIGKYESLVTQIARSSDIYITKNTAKDGTITPFDEVLLPEYLKALDDTAPKKFIVLHPLGTHLLYRDRYPDTFNIFSGNSPSVYDHKQAHSRSNAYDNAVLYHDQFIKQVFYPINNLGHPCFLIYFSDHGEEVYESIDFSGHSIENPTKSMLEIPFFLWMNDSFKKDFTERYYPKNPYVLDDFIHTFSDLVKARFSAYDSTQSIFFKQDNAIRRQLGNGMYYDELP